MAVYQFSALSDGQAISFNPASDTLNFDQPAIAAADLRVVTEGSSIRINVVSGSSTGKDVVLLNTTQLQLATSNISFADGSRLLFGDNTAAQTADEGANSLTGAAGGDLLQGFGGSDTLTGGTGNDVLDGGTAFDRLVGGAGNDTFLFTVAPTGPNADLVIDFVSGADKIALDVATYSAAGALGDFAAGDARFYAAAGATTGHDANDRVIYNTTNGTLWYDADGSGSGATRLIATLQNRPALTASDITVASSTPVSGGGGSTINGTAGNDTLTGTAGNDTIDGLAGDDLINGLGGDDSLIGGAGADRIFGGDGNDTIEGLHAFGDDTIDGGAGVDTQVSSNGGQLGINVENGILRGYNPTLGVGLAGNELDNLINDEGSGWTFLDGSAGDDTLIGGTGMTYFTFNNFPSGDGANDYGQDSLDGGAGNFDRLLLENVVSAVTVDFRNGTMIGGGTSPLNHVTFVNIERAQGSLFNDLMFAGNNGNDLGGYGGDDTLIGGAGNDSLEGDAGWDHPEVDPGNDSMLGGGGNDVLSGNIGDDRLDGGTGNDQLGGGEGSDTYIFSVAAGAANADSVADFSPGADKIELDGTVHANSGATGNFTAGDQRFWGSTTGTAHDATDRVLYNTGTGELWYDADGSGAGVRQLLATLEGAPTLSATDIAIVNGSGGGTGGGQTINGTSGNDAIIGTPGDDTINGLGGNDFLAGEQIDSPQQGNDLISGGDGNDVLEGRGGNDTLLGGAGDDSFTFDAQNPDFFPFPGNDFVDGGDGIDQVGFSTEGVSSTGAVTIDLGAGTYTIADSRGQVSGTVINVERVQTSGFADSVRGSDVANWVDAFRGDDTVLGLGGNDTLGGSIGNDSIDGGAGDDLLMGDDTAFVQGNDTLIGGAGNDTLDGGGGNDTFSFAVAPGAANADQIAGFTTGQDGIQLDGTVHANSGASGNFAASDQRFWASITGTAHDATDRVLYNTTNGELWYDADGNGAGARQLIATLQGAPALAATDIAVVNGSGGGGGGSVINGTAGNDNLTGTQGNDTINGLAGNDTLSGLGGDDFLDGGDGIDTLDGGLGDDTYFVTTGDVINPDAGGIDTVMSSVSWSLSVASNVENLTLQGTAAATASGNALDNILTGNDASNGSINGRAGNDTMFGMGGNDTFDMSTGGTSTYGNDSIDGGAGTDTVDFGVNARSGVTANLGAGTMSGGGDAGAGSATLVSIENFIGGSFNDSLTGSAGANALYGAVGNDTLNGGAGADRLNGGSGNDHFVFANAGNANADLVADFATGVDKLDLENGVYAAIGAAGNFSAGDARYYSAAGATAGHDANDRVIYNTTTGNLYYDADGSGAGTAQLVATIQGHPAVAATDIAVI